MAGRVNYSGLVIAGIGFFLTRFTVTFAIYNDPVRFYLAGVLPLALGLGLAAFGVALAVADVDPALVRTTAIWCVVGAATMLVLVVLTLVGSAGTGLLPDVETMRSRTYLSNFLIGGSVGGTLTGLYAARTRRQRREVRRQANRLDVLNRLLRHEVLNAVAVIRGYATTDADPPHDSAAVIEDHLDAIEETIDGVKYMTRSRSANGGAERTDLATNLAASVESIREEYPGASIEVDGLPESLPVRANDRLEQVFSHLLENAVTYAETDEPRVEVSVSETPRRARVCVRDEGPGLPARQRELLERGEIEEFDDPATGFGLNLVRLLVESYDGEIETAVDESGSEITVVLARVEDDEAGLPASVTDVRPALPALLVTLGAAVIAGVVYGLVSESLGGSIASIGFFYGTASPDPVVGWFTHEFHSVVFGFVFAGLVSLVPADYREGFPDRPLAYLGVGVAWALVLWVGAAGIVAPIWLRLVGVPASIPNLTFTLLVSHLAWGITLGALTAVGNARLAPRLSSLWDRGRPGVGPRGRSARRR